MLADELDYVLGVDTHRDEHVLAVVAAPAGAVVAQRSVRANARGYRGGASRSPGSTRRAGASGRSRAPAATAPVSPAILAGRGETVLEVSRAPRAERRLRGKDDALDAARTARAALASETLALPRAGERREALRLLLVARRSAVDVRREALDATARRDRDRPRRAPPGAARAADRAGCSTAAAASAAPARPAPTSSRHGSCCAASPAGSRQQPSKPTSSSARSSPTCARSHPQLLDEPGVGPIVAAQLIVAWSHRGRAALRSRLRTTRRRRTRPRLQRPDHPAPAQPRRRPPTQPRPPHDRPPPPPTRPGNQGLHRPTHRRRQNPPRRHPPTQALPRPPPLPRTRTTEPLMT